MMTTEERELYEEAAREEEKQPTVTDNFVIEPTETQLDDKHILKYLTFKTRYGKIFATGTDYEIMYDDYIKVKPGEAEKWTLFNRHGEIEGKAKNVFSVIMPNKDEYVVQQSQTGTTTDFKKFKTRAAHKKTAALLGGLLALGFVAGQYMSDKDNEINPSYAQVPATYLGTSRDGIAGFDTDNNLSTIEAVTIIDDIIRKELNKQIGTTKTIGEWAQQAGYSPKAFLWIRQHE